MRNGASWLAVKLFFIEMGQEESKAPVERPQVEVEYGPKQEYLWKIVVLGNEGVGKTAVLKRLVHDLFSIQYFTTDRVDFSYITIQPTPSVTIRLQIWDIAGKERFGKFTRVYYEGSLAAVVVADLTDVSASLKAAALWANDVRGKIELDEGIPLPMILLANKADLLEEDEQKMLRKKLDAFARKNGFFGWWMTSAKDSLNVERPFQVLVNKLFKLRETIPLIRQTLVENEEEESSKPAADRMKSRATSNIYATTGTDAETNRREDQKKRERSYSLPMEQ